MQLGEGDSSINTFNSMIMQAEVLFIYREVFVALCVYSCWGLGRGDSIKNVILASDQAISYSLNST